MAAVLTAFGWVALVVLLALTALLVRQLLADDRGYEQLSATAGLTTLCGAICILGALGRLPALAAIILGMVAAIGAVALGVDLVHKVKDPHPVAKLLGGLVLVCRLVVREAIGRDRQASGQRAGKRRPRDARASQPGASRPAGTGAAPARRMVPPARKDPGRTVTPLPKAVTQGDISMAWGQVITEIAEFEPETDVAFLDHWAAQVRGFIGVSDAMLDQADYLADELGLAQVIIGAVYDGADEVSSAAEAIASIRQWLLRAYEGSREDAAQGHDMPNNGRFITGEGEDAA